MIHLLERRWYRLETGWIRLHRRLLDNGHLHMPHLAFKIWIYILLSASRSDNKRYDVGVGECWRTYDDIMEECAVTGVGRPGRSQISKALDFLEEGGYIQRIYATKGKGVKLRVLNWSRYQTETYSPEYSPSDSPNSSPNHSPSDSPTLGLIQEVQDIQEKQTNKDNARVRDAVSLEDADSSRRINKANFDHVNRMYFSIMGSMPTTFQVSELLEFVDYQGMSVEVIVEALKTAATNEARKLAYVLTVLRNWQEKGVKTLDEAKIAQAEHEIQQKEKNLKLTGKRKLNNEPPPYVPTPPKLFDKTKFNLG